MKRTLSIIVLALFLVTMLPIGASATTTDTMSYNQHIALAKQTFPEYAGKLDGSQASRSIAPQSENVEPVAVTRETRAVDDNTIMTYTEYNNGVITLGTARFNKNAHLEVDSSTTFRTYTDYTATITASVVEGPTFTATGVEYRIYPSAYDKILSIGSYSIPGYSSSKFTTYLRSEETASLFACASYSFVCPVGLSEYDGEVILKLRNNTASVEFNIW